MKKLFFFLPAIALFLAIATGCATTKFRVEPESPEMDTLIIGQIEVTVTGWPPPTEINGIHERNVQVYLYDYFEGERVQLVSKGEGVFYLICSHDSRAIHIYGFVIAGKSKAGTSTLTLHYGKEFTPECGKVNNIG
ncbi:MAG TPA: hypothetical protein VMZ05_11370 [Spirochaetota bacterium]|nr:hypothetical protein [Spirochaetota bacterium]